MHSAEEKGAQHKDGRRLYIEISFALVKEGSGSAVGSVAVARIASPPRPAERQQGNHRSSSFWTRLNTSSMAASSPRATALTSSSPNCPKRDEGLSYSRTARPWSSS